MAIRIVLVILNGIFIEVVESDQIASVRTIRKYKKISVVIIEIKSLQRYVEI